MDLQEIEVFAPATIANISCGFDVMGCCLDAIGDVMIIKKTVDQMEDSVKFLKVLGSYPISEGQE